MQREVKKTMLSVREDFPTSIASTWNGANIDCMAFNTSFITKRDPDLAVELIQLYAKAWKLRDAQEIDKNDSRYESVFPKLLEIIKEK